jgi:hypothetical protein
MLGLVAPRVTVNNDGSCSRRLGTATRNTALAMPASV